MDNTSPRPWKVNADPDFLKDKNRIFEIQDANGKTIVETDCGFYPPSKADADLIVQSVNRADLFEEMAERLRHTDECYSIYILLANKPGAGKWIGKIRDLVRRLDDVKQEPPYTMNDNEKAREICKNADFEHELIAAIAAVLAEARESGFKDGRLDAQYDKDTLPEQIEAYKRKSYADGRRAGLDEAAEVATKEICDQCPLAQEIAREIRAVKEPKV